jgi:hypothetical protein
MNVIGSNGSITTNYVHEQLADGWAWRGGLLVLIISFIIHIPRAISLFIAVYRRRRSNRT